MARKADGVKFAVQELKPQDSNSVDMEKKEEPAAGQEDEEQGKGNDNEEKEKKGGLKK
jgi:hypothetical protein